MYAESKKEWAKELRGNGVSFKEIAALTGIAVGTVYYWTKNVEITDDMKDVLMMKGPQAAVLAVKAKKVRKEAFDREQAEKEWPEMRKNPDFMFGLALYMGEGFKTEGTIGMSNAEPELLRAALRFFGLIGCDLSNIRCGIQIHTGDDPDKALQYWALQLRCSPDRFEKISVVEGNHFKGSRHLKYGTGKIRLGQINVKRKLNRWMELARQEMG